MNFMCQCFGTLCLFHLHRRVGMKNIQHSEHSKSLKSRIIHLYWEEIARHIRQRATFRTWREFEIKNLLNISLIKISTNAPETATQCQKLL